MQPTPGERVPGWRQLDGQSFPLATSHIPTGPEQALSSFETSGRALLLLLLCGRFRKLVAYV